MKKINKWIIAVIVGVIVSATACVDDVDFGDNFLEKAPGGTVTKDTVFSKAEYTRQFVNSIYSWQYYGLPFRNGSTFPYPNNPYTGKFEVLSDCWHNHWSGAGMQSQYYSGSHSSSYGRLSDKFDFLRSNVWEAVRACWILLENVDKVPDMDDAEKKKLKAEAKCLLASRYYDTFRHYGGLPIIKNSFSGLDGTYNIPRGTVEETVNFITGLLDEAAPDLPWSYTAAEASNETGRWTKAGAMGLKCTTLLFAASPLFNSAEPFSSVGAESVTQYQVWYGSYKAELWDQCLKACEAFFTELNSRGGYSLEQASGTRPSDYRSAYRKAYYTQGSSEILHSVRVMTTDAFKSGNYVWHTWNDTPARLNYNPTQEYIEMFPWADGKPFDWEETEKAGKLNQMFTTGTVASGIQLTRDPRLYETAIVNGMQKSLDMNNGNMSGNSYELWVGGTDALSGPKNEDGQFASGYANNKYYIGADGLRQYTQWVYLRLPEIQLTYAEALLYANRFDEAIAQIDKVRARVGLKGLVQSNPSKNLKSDKNVLLQEILRERVCELGMEDCRFFDMIRYKMKDRFEKPLHGLRIYRLKGGKRVETAWYNGDRKDGIDQPTDFEYEKFEMKNPTRYWWTNGFDTKWYLSPFPITEVNKGYGLTQNPGW